MLRKREEKSDEEKLNTEWMRQNGNLEWEVKQRSFMDPVAITRILILH